MPNVPPDIIRASDALATDLIAFGLRVEDARSAGLTALIARRAEPGRVRAALAVVRDSLAATIDALPLPGDQAPAPGGTDRA